MLREGLSFIVTRDVTMEMSAQHLGSGDMEVLATPAMIAVMENAAMLCVAPHMEDGFGTVGVMIETTHTRATAIGKSIEVTALVTAVEGRKISFNIVAKDDKGVIGSAKHDRFVVDRVKFLSRL